jgi:hypothetical protein
MSKLLIEFVDASSDKFSARSEQRKGHLGWVAAQLTQIKLRTILRARPERKVAQSRRVPGVYWWLTATHLAKTEAVISKSASWALKGTSTDGGSEAVSAKPPPVAGR